MSWPVFHREGIRVGQQKRVHLLGAATLEAIFDNKNRNDVIFVDMTKRNDNLVQFSARNATSSVELRGMPPTKPDVVYPSLDVNFFHKSRCGHRSNCLIPWDFTRWVANNTEGVVVLVGTGVTPHLDAGSFLDRCLLLRYITSGGRILTVCHHCNDVATFATNQGDVGVPLCARHARSCPSDIVLYVPVIVDISLTSDTACFRTFDGVTPFSRAHEDLLGVQVERWSKLVVLKHKDGVIFYEGRTVTSGCYVGEMAEIEKFRHRLARKRSWHGQEDGQLVTRTLSQFSWNIGKYLLENTKYISETCNRISSFIWPSKVSEA